MYRAYYSERVKDWGRLQYGHCYAGCGVVIAVKPAHVSGFYNEPFHARHGTDSLRVALFSIRRIAVW